MRRVVMVVIAALLFVPLYLKSRPSQDIPARPAFRALSSERVAVKVSGDVRHPGIYKVSVNALAENVINMAEPVRALNHNKSDAAAAGPLQNGSAVRLTFKKDGAHLVTVNQMTVPERLVLGIPLDIAVMNEVDFDRLPGIGPALARRIIEYRQKNGGILRVADLASVYGIGVKKYIALCSYFQHPVNTR